MRIKQNSIVVGGIACLAVVGVIVFVLVSSRSARTDDIQRSGRASDPSRAVQMRSDMPGDGNSADVQAERPELGHENDKLLTEMLEDLVEGDVVDVMEAEWSSRQITADFTDRDKFAEVIDHLPVIDDTGMPEGQRRQLQAHLTDVLFLNGNDDRVSYLRILRKSGETVKQSICDDIRTIRIQHFGIPEDKIPRDPWELLAPLNEEKSNWEGIVSEGSEIKVFTTRSSDYPLYKQKELFTICRSVVGFNDLTEPPVSLEAVLQSNGEVLMADMVIFIAHTDEMGGIVWPYVIRSWFDPINGLWRTQAASLFHNPKKRPDVYMLP